jgi:hypothetical protein
MSAATFATAVGLSLVVLGAVAALAWRRGRLDHRAPAGILATAGMVLTVAVVMEPVGAHLDPYPDRVSVPDVHGLDAASGRTALQAAGLETREVATCWGDVDPGTITDVRLLERRLWVSLPRVVVDQDGVSDDARRLWPGAEVIVGVRDTC